MCKSKASVESLPLVLYCHRPLFEKDRSWFGYGGELDGPGLLSADAAVGTEEDFDPHRNIVLPQEKHVLAEILILLALKNKCFNRSGLDEQKRLASTCVRKFSDWHFNVK